MANAQLIPELDRKGLRDFGLITGGIVAVLFGLMLPWLLGRVLPVWPWVVFAVLAAWSVVAPSTLRLVYRGWMRFGLLMSRVMIPLLMSLVFFLVVTPIGAVRRLLSKDEIAKHADAALESYRQPSEARKRKDLERPF